MPANNALQTHYKKADRLMLMLSVGLFLVSLCLAPMYETWSAALTIGGGTLLLVAAVFFIAPGQVVSRVSFATGFMVMTALHIQQSQGMIEFHFGVFVLLALLLYYRDWIPVVVAAAVIAVHHVLFYYLQTQGSELRVLPDRDNAWWIIFVHAAYVVVETSIVVWMAHDLRKEFVITSELQQATEHILQGEKIDLSYRTSGDSELLARFDAYTATVASLVNEVSDNTQLLHETSGDLVVVTDTVKQQSSSQREQTDMISSAVEEMTASAKEVAGNASDAAKAADEANRYALDCKRSSEDSENSIRNLEKQVMKAASTISSLDDETKQIGTLLDVIRDIADQTNLLALNAAIEAARAGEQGRGFAVVADEVRTLAQRTQQSTEEIDRMIVNLQNGSKSAVGAIEDSRQLVEEAVGHTKRNLALMVEVTAAVENIDAMNQLIASSAQEQSTVTSEISNNIAMIVESSHTMAEQIAESAEDAQKLEALACQLDILRARFA
ncbi:MAG: methyl-accepting chemotaxis protein [Oleiphilaceae bacterium]|nr:methyl-accepting chemotaxis protein [Oleiphilaceae bacterium]